MRVTFPLFLLFSVAPVWALTVPVDCSHGQSLQEAVEWSFPGSTLRVSGTCSGPLLIHRNVTIESRNNAVLRGDGKTDVLTVNGPARVTLTGLTIEGGVNGVNGQGGAQLEINSTTVRQNLADGILLTGGSSATLSASATNSNGLNGLDAEASSSVILTGSFHSEGNTVFGVNINGSSSLTFTQAQVVVSGNVLGVQIGTSASAFISDSATTLTVKNNFSTGLTIVSGAHMVAFGGTITTTGNAIHGVSVDSKAGLDLDAAAVLNTSGNGQDGLHLEETSVVTMFNTPAFSGAPGVTTVNTQGNAGNGVSVLTGSNLTIIHQASLNSTGNLGDGVLTDNGSSLTLIQSNVTGNAKDVVLSFGSRGDITTTVLGTLTCDASVLLRGDTGRTCK